jgi:hypothetical protein
MNRRDLLLGTTSVLIAASLPDPAPAGPAFIEVEATDRGWIVTRQNGVTLGPGGTLHFDSTMRVQLPAILPTGKMYQIRWEQNARRAG